MLVYADSSALTKRYVEEPDSGRFLALMDDADATGCSLLGISEVLSGIAKARRMQALTDDAASEARASFGRDVGEIAWLGIDRALVVRAGALLWQHGLRSADAIHLATAVQWAADDLIFATFDQRLAEAARAEGLAVWP